MALQGVSSVPGVVDSLKVSIYSSENPRIQENGTFVQIEGSSRNL